MTTRQTTPDPATYLQHAHDSLLRAQSDTHNWQMWVALADRYKQLADGALALYAMNYPTDRANHNG